MCTTVTHLTLPSTRVMGDKCISDGCSQCSCLSLPVADRALLSDFCLALFFTVCIFHFFLVIKTTRQNPINCNTELGFFGQHQGWNLTLRVPAVTPAWRHTMRDDRDRRNHYCCRKNHLGGERLLFKTNSGQENPKWNK